MSIPVACVCGHRWNVSEALDGLEIQCPHCRSQCLVAATAGSSQGIAAQPLAPPSGGSHAFSAEPPGMPMPPRIEIAAIPRRSGRVWLLMAAAATLILCAVGVGAVWLYYREGAAGAGADLPFLKADAAVIVSLRVADFMDQPGGKRMREILEKLGGDDIAKFEKFFGVPIGNVERATVVATAKPGEGYVVVLLKKPVDLSRFGIPEASVVVEKSGEFTYHRYKSLALYRQDNRVFVLGTNEGVRAALAHAARPAVDAERLLAQIRSGRFHLFARLKADATLRDDWLRGDFGEARQLKADLLGDTITLAIRETDAFDAELEIAYASVEKAKSGKAALDKLRQWSDAPPGAPQAARDILRELRAMRIEQSGTTVTAGLKTALVLSAAWLNENNRQALEFEERETKQIAKDLRLSVRSDRPHVALLYSGIHRGLQLLPEFVRAPGVRQPIAKSAFDQYAWERPTRVAGAYYYYKGPFGQVMQRLSNFHGWGGVYCDARLPATIVAQGALMAPASGFAPLGMLWSEPPLAVLGMGNGSPAAYARPFQTIDFYESNQDLIDVSLPGVGKQARMTFVEDAVQRGAHVRVFKGDLHASFAAGPKGFYRAVLVESSPYADTAILEPLENRFYTREGLQHMLDAMTPEGIACYHNSHRYLELEKPLAAAAADLRAVAWAARDQGGFGGGGDGERGRDPFDEVAHFSSHWVLVARHEGILTPLQDKTLVRGKGEAPRYWERVDPAGAPVWTDAGGAPIADCFRSDPYWASTFASVWGISRVWLPLTSGVRIDAWGAFGPGSEPNAFFLECFAASGPTNKWFDQHRP